MWFHKKNAEDMSVEAVKESLENLKKTELRSASVHEVSTALRTLRERNHFAEQLESIMGGPR
jgi:hypothetical protein